MTTHGRAIGIVAGLAMLRPGTVLACAVCFSASSGRVLATYVLTAAAMTVLPLLIVGGLAVWIRRRLRSAAEPPQSFQA